jgi:hypothetical protein
MSRSRLLGFLLLAAVVRPAWLASRQAWSCVAAAPGWVRNVAASDSYDRAHRTLEEFVHVPRIREAAALARPAVSTSGIFETSFGFVTPGVDPRTLPALRGATLLLYELAPRAWVAWAPSEYLEGELRLADAPLGPYLHALSACPFIIWTGIDAAEMERFHALTNRRFGREVLVPGWTNGTDLHVSLRFDVARGLADGAAEFRRFALLARQ